MKRAAAFKRVSVTVVGDADVTHLRMQGHARVASNDRPPSYTCSNGQVERVCQASGGSPTNLSENRSIHIGIKADLKIERALDFPAISKFRQAAFGVEVI